MFIDKSEWNRECETLHSKTKRVMPQPKEVAGEG